MARPTRMSQWRVQQVKDFQAWCAERGAFVVLREDDDGYKPLAAVVRPGPPPPPSGGAPTVTLDIDDRRWLAREDLWWQIVDEACEMAPVPDADRELPQGPDLETLDRLAARIGGVVGWEVLSARPVSAVAVVMRLRLGESRWMLELGRETFIVDRAGFKNRLAELVTFDDD